MKLKIRWNWVVEPVFVALLVALAFPPFGVWPLAMVGFGIFFRRALLDRHDAKACATRFAVYAFFVNLFGFYWISYTLREFGGIPWLAAVPLMLLIFAIFSILPYGAGWVWGRYSVKLPPLAAAPALALFWIFFDGLEPRLFPWSPVMSVGSVPLLMASANSLGTWGWRFLFFGAAAAVAALSLRHRGRRLALWSLIPVGITFGFGFGLGKLDRDMLRKRYSDRQPVAMIQGNIGNYDKKLTKLGVVPTIQNVLAIHRTLVEKAAIHMTDKAREGIEPWYFWPETAFPGYPLDASANQGLMAEWAKLGQGTHLIGAYETALDNFAGRQIPMEFNIVALFHESNGLVSYYRKNIRLMFGEYIPGDNWMPWIYKLLPAVNHFGGGREQKPLAHPSSGGAVFIPLVCYELLFDRFVDRFVSQAKKEYPGRPLVLVNPSNDSWYGPTSEQFQNAFLARWAAARQGLPLARPTNTGDSILVAPWGEVMTQGPRDETTVIFGELPVQSIQRRLE